MTASNDFQISGAGFYRTRNGKKVELVARSKSNPNVWLTANGGWYRNNEIAGVWENDSQISPEGYIILDGIDIPIEELQAQRIATLESALREIWQIKYTGDMCEKAFLICQAHTIAKEALGEME